MTQIVFSHGNSFPSGTYSVLFDHLRQRGFDVSAVDRFGHDPRFPVTNNWPNLVEQLAEFAAERVRASGGPVYLVGHSLGGILSVMAAAMHPELARGVLMVDSPLISGWRATTVGVAKRTQMVGSVSPGRVSRLRRNSWASTDEAYEHFHKKKAFARWDPQVLRDYVTHGLYDEEDRRVLAFATPGGIHWRPGVGRAETGGHGTGAAHHPGPHFHARWQPPFSDGKAQDDRSRHRGVTAQPGFIDRRRLTPAFTAVTTTTSTSSHRFFYTLSRPEAPSTPSSVSILLP